jgi:hypothetical protein
LENNNLKNKIMGFFSKLLKNTKIGKFLKDVGIHMGEEKHHKNKHHHFSDNDDDNWNY